MGSAGGGRGRLGKALGQAAGGLGLAALWSLGSLLLARLGFRNEWQLGILLPLGALSHLLLAWLLYLRDDGLARRPRAPEEGPDSRQPGAGARLSPTLLWAALALALLAGALYSLAGVGAAYFG